jgi:phosphinothricin acetyltransferase
MKIELASRSDLPRIVEIANWAAAHTAANFALEPEPLDMWVESWEKTHEHHPWLVAREGTLVMGFAKSGPHKARGAYRWTAELTIYLAPEHHGRGIGTALYGVLIPMLEAQGYVTLLAGITSGHTPSERLHARVGFVRCATFHRTGWKFDRWHDVGYWERHLQPEAPPGRILPVASVLEHLEKAV